MPVASKNRTWTCLQVECALKQAGIYMIRHRASGRAYVGNSVDVCARWKQHRSQLGSNKHHNKELQSAWNEFGRDAFEWTILECVDDRVLRINRELVLIQAQENPYNRSLDTNTGPRLGHKHTPEARANMRAAQIGRPPMSAEQKAKLSTYKTGRSCPAQSAKLKGRALTEAHRERIRAGGKRRWAEMSDEQRKAIGASIAKQYEGHVVTPKERARRSAANLGKKRTNETKALMRAARLGKPWTEAQRSAICAAKTGRPWSAKQREAIVAGKAKAREVRLARESERAPLSTGTLAGSKQSAPISQITAERADAVAKVH